MANRERRTKLLGGRLRWDGCVLVSCRVPYALPVRSLLENRLLAGHFSCDDLHVDYNGRHILLRKSIH